MERIITVEESNGGDDDDDKEDDDEEEDEIRGELEEAGEDDDDDKDEDEEEEGETDETELRQKAQLAQKHSKTSAGLCKEASTKWSSCSKTCDVGVSHRMSNQNDDCAMRLEQRLCFLRPCQMTFKNQVKVKNRPMFKHIVFYGIVSVAALRDVRPPQLDVPPDVREAASVRKLPLATQVQLEVLWPV